MTLSDKWITNEKAILAVVSLLFCTSLVLLVIGSVNIIYGFNIIPTSFSPVPYDILLKVAGAACLVGAMANLLLAGGKFRLSFFILFAAIARLLLFPDAGISLPTEFPAESAAKARSGLAFLTSVLCFGSVQLHYKLMYWDSKCENEKGE